MVPPLFLICIPSLPPFILPLFLLCLCLPLKVPSPDSLLRGSYNYILILSTFEDMFSGIFSLLKYKSEYWKSLIIQKKHWKHCSVWGSVCQGKQWNRQLIMNREKNNVENKQNKGSKNVFLRLCVEPDADCWQSRFKNCFLIKKEKVVGLKPGEYKNQKSIQPVRLR